MCESENRQQHKRIDTDVEFIGIRERESTMAADLCKFRSTLKIQKLFQGFWFTLDILVAFLENANTVHGIIFAYLKFEHQFHFSFIELNGNCGLLSSIDIFGLSVNHYRTKKSRRRTPKVLFRISSLISSILICYSSNIYFPASLYKC